VREANRPSFIDAAAEYDKAMDPSDSAVTIPNEALPATKPEKGEGSARADKEGVESAAFPLRYELGELLGQGGMGFIRACRDRRIGREVALKMARPEHASKAEVLTRFVREACVQGQLEHPAIVPVYDLGRDPDGNVYFTMKRVRGATFEKIVQGLRSGDSHTVERYSRRKLLVAFASVCQALTFAHARGVVHRDIKPGNVMLGDFGEVYVLDWGLAKLTLGPERAGGPVAGATEDRAVSEPRRPPARAGATLQGMTMGTPGYMAPEQARGESVDARTDVYALGAILFELLALQPLHVHASQEAMLTSTLIGVDARPSFRAPHLDIPPELDAVCVRATALDPAGRFGSARELVAAIERFLDGDRDLRRRVELARDHAQTAASLAQQALTSTTGAAEARSNALREVGRAIALDPANPDALRTLVRLLAEPPREIPPEARVELARERSQSLTRGRRMGGMAFLTWFLYVPVTLWMGVRSWGAVTLMHAAWLVAAAVGFLAARGSRADDKANLPMLLTGGFAIACSAALLGPYFLLPQFALIYAMMFILIPPDRARRGLVVAMSLLTMLVPAALGWTGVLPRPYELHQDAVTVRAWMLHFPPAPTELFLVLTNVVALLTACLMTSNVREALTAAQERLHVQAWQLRQMLPREAQMSAPPAEPAASRHAGQQHTR
jgi:serine/threonine-protein kinase